jgi:hypothetical protein
VQGYRGANTSAMFCINANSGAQTVPAAGAVTSNINLKWR